MICEGEGGCTYLTWILVTNLNVFCSFNSIVDSLSCLKVFYLAITASIYSDSIPGAPCIFTCRWSLVQRYLSPLHFNLIFPTDLNLQLI